MTRLTTTMLVLGTLLGACGGDPEDVDEVNWVPAYCVAEGSNPDRNDCTGDNEYVGCPLPEDDSPESAAIIALWASGEAFVPTCSDSRLVCMICGTQPQNVGLGCFMPLARCISVL